MSDADRADAADRWQEVVSREIVRQVNRVGPEEWNYTSDPDVARIRARSARMLGRAADRAHIADCQARGVRPEGRRWRSRAAR